MESSPDQWFSSDDDDERWAHIGDPEWVWEGPSAAEIHEASLDDLEGISVRGRMLVADRYRIIGDLLRDAEETPDPWVGPDPTLDPLWVDPRERSVAAVRRERREFAVRAAAADIAVRLRMPEMTVRTHAAHAQTLRERCPKVWAAFRGGEVCEQNAVTAAQLAQSLPADDTIAWAVFDEQVAGPAARLTPGKFRVKARAVRERVHAESLQERHQRAVTDRGVWVTPELDGMAYLTALLPADTAHAVADRLDVTAQHLRAQEDEQRTLAQLRADVFTDLLISGAGAGAGAGSGAGAGVGVGTGASGGATGIAPTVAITVPVMTLLGESDEPATLDGYGPIDLNTAKRLAGTATSWIRILTHPVTGTVLDVDRTTYRVPKALRRWLGVQHPVCVFPGCTRRARACDIDHLVDWQYGGKTASINLAPGCKSHHPLKHHSKWRVAKNPDTGTITWTSPTGHTTDADPPPF